MLHPSDLGARTGTILHHCGAASRPQQVRGSASSVTLCCQAPNVRTASNNQSAITARQSETNGIGLYDWESPSAICDLRRRAINVPRDVRPRLVSVSGSRCRFGTALGLARGVLACWACGGCSGQLRVPARAEWRQRRAGKASVVLPSAALRLICSISRSKISAPVLTSPILTPVLDNPTPRRCGARTTPTPTHYLYATPGPRARSTAHGHQSHHHHYIPSSASAYNGAVLPNHDSTHSRTSSSCPPTVQALPQLPPPPPPLRPIASVVPKMCLRRRGLSGLWPPPTMGECPRRARKARGPALGEEHIYLTPLDTAPCNKPAGLTAFDRG